MAHAHFMYGDAAIADLPDTLRDWADLDTAQVIVCENPTDSEGIGILALSPAEAYSPALCAAAFEAHAETWWDPDDGSPADMTAWAAAWRPVLPTAAALEAAARHPRLARA